MSSTVPRTATLVFGTAMLLACGDHAPTDPFAPAQAHELSALMTTEARLAEVSRLVHCPTTESRSVTKTFGILGGSLVLDGTRVTVPVGAVLLPTTITLTLPESKHMEIDLTANARDHFRFPVPLHVTIDYSRCARGTLSSAPVTAWYIDGESRALLEWMRGHDDRAARRVTFTTVHFSGYSIAQ